MSGDLQIVARWTIPDNDDTSDEVPLEAVEIHALVIPAGWVTADVRFLSRIRVPVSGRDRADVPTDAFPTPLVLSVEASQYRLLSSDEEGTAEGLWVTSIQSVNTADADTGVNQTGGPLVILAVGRQTGG